MSSPNGKEDEIVAALVALGLNPPISQEQLEAAYKKLSRIYHPDTRGTGDTETFQRVAKAREVLKKHFQEASTIQLGFKRDVARLASESGDLLKDLQETKSKNQSLRRQMDELNSIRLLAQAKMRLYVQCLAIFCVILLLGSLGGFGYLLFGKPPVRPQEILLAPGSFPAFTGLGPVALEFVLASRRDSTVEFTSIGFGSGNSVSVEMPSGVAVEGNELIFDSQSKFRIRSEALRIELGEADRDALSALLRNWHAEQQPPIGTSTIDDPTSPGIPVEEFKINERGGRIHE